MAKKSIKDHELASDVEAQGRELTAVVDAEDVDELDVLGHAMIYTVGDLELERDWLVNQMEELNLPGWMQPREVTPKRAFNRTRKRLVERDDDEMWIVGPDGEDRRAKFNVEKVTNDVFQIDAKVLFTADDLDSEEGEWRTTTLGSVRYIHEHEAIVTTPDIGREESLWEAWEHFASKAQEKFTYMQEAHTGKDLQKMLSRFVKHWTSSVKLRSGGAVYFVPAQYSDEVGALKTLLDRVNVEWKESGRRTEVQRIPVIDSDEQREMVEARVQVEVEERLEDAMSDVSDELTEAEDTDEVVDEVMDVFEEQFRSVEDFAAEYNALLQAEMDVRGILEEWTEAMTETEQEIVEEVIEA